MIRNLFNRWKLSHELSKVEKGHDKVKQTKKYKELTPQEKRDEDDMFYQGDYLPIWEEIETLKTQELLKKASRLTIPITRHWEDKEEKYWTRSGYTGEYYLTVKGQHQLINAIWEKQRVRRENWVWFVPVIALFSSFFSATAAWKSLSISNNSSLEQKQARLIELRPYLMVNLFNSVLECNKGSVFIKLPYFLQNSGRTPAFNIQKEYTSYLVDFVGKEQVVQHYIASNGENGDLLPAQSSPINIDNINISGFDPAKYKSIKIILMVSYDQKGSKDRIKTTVVLNLTPQVTGDIVEFLVSIPAQFIN